MEHLGLCRTRRSNVGGGHGHCGFCCVMFNVHDTYILIKCSMCVVCCTLNDDDNVKQTALCVALGCVKQAQSILLSLDKLRTVYVFTIYIYIPFNGASWTRSSSSHNHCTDEVINYICALAPAKGIIKWLLGTWVFCVYV